MFEMEFGDIAKVLDGNGSATLPVFGLRIEPQAAGSVPKP
jgi:hypothetical protein